jgi:hypothetical protein
MADIRTIEVESAFGASYAADKVESYIVSNKALRAASTIEVRATIHCDKLSKTIRNRLIRAVTHRVVCQQGSWYSNGADGEVYAQLAKLYKWGAPNRWMTSPGNRTPSKFVCREDDWNEHVLPLLLMISKPSDGGGSINKPYHDGTVGFIYTLEGTPDLKLKPLKKMFELIDNRDPATVADALDFINNDGELVSVSTSN